MRLFKIPALFKHVKPGSQLFLFFSFWVLFFVFFAFLSAVLVSKVFHLPSATADLPAEIIEKYKLVQLITSIGIFVLPPLLLTGLFTEHPGKFLRMTRLPNIHTLVLTFLILFFAVPLLNLVIEWNAGLELPDSLTSLEKDAEELTKMFLKAGSPMQLILNVILIALVPAIGEELLFRGVFQQFLHRITRNHHLAIWFAAMIFSLFHFQFYGFVPRMMLGALFGYLLAWSGSLWVPVFAHFVNNASAVIVSYMAGEGDLQEKIDTIGTDGQTWYYAVVSAVLLSIMLWFFYRENKGNFAELADEPVREGLLDEEFTDTENLPGEQ